MISEVTLNAETVAADLRPVLLRLARELRKETEQLGITARQATLLWLVKRSPGLSLAELAAEEGISPPALSGHVDRLERAGLIERLRSTDDRRRVGLRLTDEGARMLSACASPPNDMARRPVERARARRAGGDRRRRSGASGAARGRRVTTLAIALRTRTFRSLRRHRNYRIFFTGQLVSLAGTWMQNVALAWLVLELSGSPLAVGALAFWRFVPFTVFGLVAGVVADRLESRRLVMWTQAVAMAISVALAVVTLTGWATLPIVYVLAALGGIALAFDAPGRQSLTFQMVGPRELPNAVALNTGLFNGSRIIGPAIAGLIIAAAGTGICFVLNAVSFLAVLAALAVIRDEELHPVEQDPSARVVDGLRRAFAFAWADPQLRSILGVVTVVSTVGFNFHVLVPLLASDTLHVGPGGIRPPLGIVRPGRARRRARHRDVPRGELAAVRHGHHGVRRLALPLAPVQDAVLAGVLLFAIGVSFTLFTANANAFVQLGAPDHLRGRLFGLYLFAFVGPRPSAGSLQAGWRTLEEHRSPSRSQGRGARDDRLRERVARAGSEARHGRSLPVLTRPPEHEVGDDDDDEREREDHRRRRVDRRRDAEPERPQM